MRPITNIEATYILYMYGTGSDGRYSRYHKKLYEL